MVMTLLGCHSKAARALFQQLEVGMCLIRPSIRSFTAIASLVDSEAREERALATLSGFRATLSFPDPGVLTRQGALSSHY